MLSLVRVPSLRAFVHCKPTSQSKVQSLNWKCFSNTKKVFQHKTYQKHQYQTRQFHTTRSPWDDIGSSKKTEQEDEKKNNQRDKKTEKDEKKEGSEDITSGKKEKKKNSNSDDDDRQFWSRLGLITAGSLILLTLLNYWVDSVPHGNQIDWYTFKTKFLNTGKVEKVVVYSNTNQVMVTVKDSQAPGGTRNYFFTIGDVNSFEKHMHDTQQQLGIHPNDYVPILYTKNVAHDAINFSWSVLPLIATIGITVLVFKRISGPIGGAGGSGGVQIVKAGFNDMQVFSFGKSTAKKFVKQSKVPITFKQVAGMAETKQEVMEFVDFLKNPTKYKKLGAKTPKGALLVGPPGTGKTLLAKATAGEAGVPFYSISGSEFVEMFVGVGSARVRDLFEEARADAPCIIFIDEIDAIGRARSKSSFANDERENTLNQLLVEMDGFNTESGVVVLAGTNRPDILDNALLRPGRFDRQIYIDNPDIKGRKEIFEVHLKPLKLEKVVEDYAKPLAALTPGFSGADIANVCNEGALIAARHNKTSVDMKDLEAAIERVIGGMERKNRILSPDEKKTVAYHEAGHATVGWFLEHASPLLKVSIVPRGIAALGYAMYQPKDQHMYSREQLIDMMCVSLGGRVAEWLIFGRITTGASDDLDKVTKMAYSQITQLGMSASLGPVSFQQPKEGEIVLEKPYSEATARLIDKEVRELVDIAYQKTEKILMEKRDLLEKLAQVLLEKEVIKREDMVAILGPRPWGEETTYEQITGETTV